MIMSVNLRPGYFTKVMIFNFNLYVTGLDSVIIFLPDHATPTRYPNRGLDNGARMKARFDKGMPITEHSKSVLPHRAPWNVLTCLMYEKIYEEVTDIKENLKMDEQTNKDFSEKSLCVFGTGYRFRPLWGGDLKIRTTCVLCQSCLESQWIVTKQSFIFQENRWCRL